MLPAERKKLVDKTIGLDILDDLTKYIASQESSLKSKIEAVQTFLVKPEEVIKPAGYIPSSKVKFSLESLRVLEREYNSLKALSEMTVEFPVEPEKHPRASELETLKANQALRDNFAMQMRTLENQIRNIPDAEMTLEEVIAKETYLKDYTQWLSTETSNYTAEYDTWSKAVALKARLERDKVKHDCPKCEHTWYDSDPRLAELTGLAESMLTPAQFAANLKLERAAPTLSQAQLNTQREAITKASLKQENVQLLQTVAAGFNALPDEHTTIAAISFYLNSCQVYLSQLTQAQLNQDKKHSAFSELSSDRFSQLSTISQLAQDLLNFSVYEAQFAIYEKALSNYTTHVATAALWKEEADQWSAAKKAVTALRERVKGYLMPSLNKVASSLINAMTGGVLSWITITDDFENITVEGQKLETLSGAGESVANLAIRIALGQVLTNKVYSSIQLDEIDGDCDAERSNFIAECLQRLTTQINQIIQVSHKDIKAEHSITL
jgi:DNA repair exonuclease SbcCD ATPase subunit